MIRGEFQIEGQGAFAFTAGERGIQVYQISSRQGGKRPSKEGLRQLATAIDVVMMRQGTGMRIKIVGHKEGV